MGKRHWSVAVGALFVTYADGASAQYVTSSGVQCGDDLVSVQALSSSSESARAARERRKALLKSWAADADWYCQKSPPGLPFPGCNFVAFWVKETNTLKADRGSLAILDAGLEIEARRVVASAQCLASGAPGVAKSALCVELSNAEAVAGAFELCKSDLVTDEVNKRHADSKGGAQKLMTAVVKREVEAEVDATAAWRQLQPASAKCERTYAPRATAPIVALLDRFAANPQSPTVGTDAWGSSKDCLGADIYVSPTGSLAVRIPEVAASSENACPVVKPTKVATTLNVCIDTALYAVDRPHEVEISGVARDQGQNVPLQWKRIVSAWPGEPAPIELPLAANETSVLRLTVRAEPRGASLRALAQRGSAPSKPNAGFEASDLLVDAREIALKEADGTRSLAVAKAIGTIASSLDHDASVLPALKALDEARSKSAPDEKVLRPLLVKAADALRAAISTPNASVERAAAAKVADSKIEAPAKDSDSLPALLEKADRLLRTANTLRTEATALETAAQKSLAAGSDHRRTLARLCRIAKTSVHVVDEDILWRPQQEGRGCPAVLDYDYDSGFVRQTRFAFTENDLFFLRVTHVPPGAAIGVALDALPIVEHKTSLIGLPASSPEDTALPKIDASGTKIGDTGLDPDGPAVQSTSTQILPLPRIAGGRIHDLFVCTGSAGLASCGRIPTPADPKASRVLSSSRLAVRGDGNHLGVRAGFGYAATLGELREVEQRPEGSVVRGQDVSSSFALPLLVNYYFTGRDVARPGSHFDHGPAGGLDPIVTIKGDPRVYAAYTLDYGGFGLSAGLFGELRSSVALPADSFLGTASAPKRRELFGGFFAAVTMDFDVFSRVYGAFFSESKLPVVGGGVDSK
jgi:hypothetical protein